MAQQPPLETAGHSTELPETKMPDSGPVDADKKLIDALRAFINAGASKQADPPPHVSIRDAIWLLMAFACIPLALSLLPHTWFTGESTKFIVDKVVPWFLNLGAVATILKSPDSVLAATRSSRFRWIIAVLLLLLGFTAYPAFTVKPKVIGNAIVLVDGERPPEDHFRVSFKSHDIELRHANSNLASDPKIGSRHLQINAKDLLHKALREPEWRLLYPVQMDVQNAGLKVCFEPVQFQMDQDFLADAKNKFRRVGPKALEFFSPAAGGFDIELLAGKYNVTGFVDGCGVTPSLPLDVGPGATILNTVKKARCVEDAARPPSPCDQLLGKEEDK